MAIDLDCIHSCLSEIVRNFVRTQQLMFLQISTSVLIIFLVFGAMKNTHSDTTGIW